MADPLNLGAADRAGLTELAVYRHLGPEGGHLAGKSRAGLPAQAIAPLGEGGAGPVEEPLDLAIAELARHGDRRDARPVQDLVRVGVADPAEDPLVGQGPLDGVVLAPQRRREVGQAGLQDLQPAGVVRQHGFPARLGVKRGPLLGARLGQDQGPGRKIEGRQAALLGDLRARLLPMQAARDHQVQDQPEVALEAERDALAEAQDFGCRTALESRKRRRDAAQQKGAAAPDPGQGLAEDPRLQRLDVVVDVGQLGHGRSILARPRPGINRRARRPSDRGNKSHRRLVPKARGHPRSGAMPFLKGNLRHRGKHGCLADSASRDLR